MRLFSYLIFILHTLIRKPYSIMKKAFISFIYHNVNKLFPAFAKINLTQKIDSSKLILVISRRKIELKFIYFWIWNVVNKLIEFGKLVLTVVLNYLSIKMKRSENIGNISLNTEETWTAVNSIKIVKLDWKHISFLK